MARRTACLLVGLLMAFAGVARAGERAGDRPVVVGEVSSNVARPDIDLPALLRAAVEHEVASIDVAGVRPGRRVIVSIRLLRMQAADGREGATGECVVSVALRRADGALFAMLGGSARVGDGSTPSQKKAVVVAVRSALGRLREAIAAME